MSYKNTAQILRNGQKLLPNQIYSSYLVLDLLLNCSYPFAGGRRYLGSLGESWPLSIDFPFTPKKPKNSNQPGVVILQSLRFNKD